MTSRNWLFVLSCIALVTSAFTFIVRGDVLQDMGKHFEFEQRYNGLVEGAVFWGMAGSMLLGAFIVDFIGMKNAMWLAFLCHVGGSLGTINAPDFGGDKDSCLYWLWAMSFIMGCGNGFTETAINPLVATMFPRNKTHYLNILHAWWPGGLVIGGILASIVGKGLSLHMGFINFDVEGQHFEWWQSLYLITGPAILYGLMLIPAKFPVTERVASGVSNATMFREALRPGFLLWGFCMLLTASTELGPQKWQESVMRSIADLSGTQILIYTSGMMFVLRHFAGPIAHQISPVGLLLVSSIFAAAGLYLLSFTRDSTSAFGYATIFGLGIAYFWPTMLGVVAERYPKGGALTLCLMGTFGNAAIAFAIPAMGGIIDRSSVQEVRSLEPNPALADKILMTDEKGQPIALDLNAIDKVNELARSAQPTTPEPAPTGPFADLSSEEIETLATVGTEAKKVGFSMAFRVFSILPCILIVIFGIIWIYDWSQGGYKAIHLLSPEEESELLSGGTEGPTS